VGGGGGVGGVLLCVPCAGAAGGGGGGGGWKWAGCVEPEVYCCVQIIANGKSRLPRLSIRALSFRADAPRLGSMLCRPHRYGPYIHIAIALAVGIDA